MPNTDLRKKFQAVARNPKRIVDYLQWRIRRFSLRRAAINLAPGVVHVGKRSSCRIVEVGGVQYLKKSYRRAPSADACFHRELEARRIFKGKTWLPEIVTKGDNWFLLPFYPTDRRLDRIAPQLQYEDRLEIAKQAVYIMLEMFLEGYAHCDFHAENLFWVNRALIATDFEVMTRYPDGQRPGFPECYDITGRGLESPENTQNMCYTKEHERGVSLINTLDIPIQTALSKLEDDLKHSLRSLSKTFQTQRARHECKADRIYCSFSLRHLSVAPEEAQRNSEKRFLQFGITAETLCGRTLIDLGSNIGGMVFQAQNYGPSRSLGVEFDPEKVELSRRIAAYNALHSVEFLEFDIDRLRPTDLNGPFDVAFCLAIEAHVKKPAKLYKLLSSVCSDLLFFEGNSSTDSAEVEKQLRACGFSEVAHIGTSTDDFIPGNNVRPLLIARKAAGGLGS